MTDRQVDEMSGQGSHWKQVDYLVSHLEVKIKAQTTQENAEKIYDMFKEVLCETDQEYLLPKKILLKI